MASQTEVDGQDLTIVGHSQGANFVPVIMADEPGVVAGVQLAGLAVPIDEGIVMQLRDMANVLEEANPQGYADDITALRESADDKEQAFLQIRQGTYAGDTFDGVPLTFWRNWMDLTDHLQADFSAVTKPILLFNGDLDINVNPRNLELFQSWASQADMTNAHFMLLPNVTHSFVEFTPNVTAIAADFSTEAIATMVQWHQALEL